MWNKNKDPDNLIKYFPTIDLVLGDKDNRYQVSLNQSVYAPLYSRLDDRHFIDKRVTIAVKSQKEELSFWILGTPFLKAYYTIFDL